MNDRDIYIEQARHADLADYFKTSGYTLKKVGNELYVNEIKGLSINPQSNSWYSHYEGVGRINNSLDCLKIILGKSFIQAVEELTGQDITTIHSTYAKKKTDRKIEKAAPTISKTETKKEIKNISMPEHAPTQRRVFGYLNSARMIPYSVVKEFVDAKILYQTEKEINGSIQGKPVVFRKANAVFVHKNADGNEVGGEIQGLESNKRYKGMVAGTGESYFSFSPTQTRSIRAFVFESAIDLMSFYSMCKDKSKLNGTLLVSMAGLKPHVVKQLREKNILVISAVDNDDAGRKFEKENGLARSNSVIEKLDIHGFKDWNERLVHQTKHPEFLEIEPQLIKEHREKISETNESVRSI